MPTSLELSPAVSAGAEVASFYNRGIAVRDQMNVISTLDHLRSITRGVGAQLEPNEFTVQLDKDS